MTDDIKRPSGASPEPGYAVTSTTDVVPHAADATSAPGPYRNLKPDRPPVSTTRADVPIAHGLTAGAGAGNQNQETTAAPQATTEALGAAQGASVDLDAMTKDELLAYAQQLGVKPANAAMTKDELRQGIDTLQAEGQ